MTDRMIVVGVDSSQPLPLPKSDVKAPATMARRPRAKLSVVQTEALGLTIAPSDEGMNREFSELRTNEVRAPQNLVPPSLHGHRWASAGLTTDLTGEPMFPSVPWRAGEEKTVAFPPPPPPMHPSRSTPAERHQRLMTWYQIVEVWCDEGSKADNERVVVAPPPRPPPFTLEDEKLFFSRTAIKGSPYSIDDWEKKVRHWWSHVARHFDKLRLSEKFEMKGVSKAPVSAVTPQQALKHSAL